MIRTCWRWLRQRLIHIVFGYPPLAASLVFLFLLTLSNYVYSATAFSLTLPAFWHMLLMGALMATYGSLLLYEVIRLYSKLVAVETTRSVVSTLHHEINNPLQIIQICAETLQTQKSYDEASVTHILDNTKRVVAAVIKLRELEQEVRIRREPGFTGLIDVVGSR